MNIHRRTRPAVDAARAASTSDARVTRITAETPKRLTKKFRLQNGMLQKETGGILIKGIASIRGIANLGVFSAILEELGPDQALVYGVPDQDECEIVTEQEWQRLGRPSNPVPRTAEHFNWSDGPGILMLDYDPADGVGALSQDALIEELRRAVPALAEVELLWWPSASSHIYDRDSGREVQGLRGQRIYIIVKDARDIPRAGKVIYDRLWLAGHGTFKISKSGSLLERNLIDALVWQPNRLDFAAGAACEDPLEQRRGRPVLIQGNQKQLDTWTELSDLSDAEKRRLRAQQQMARAETQEDAAKAREQWLEIRLGKMVGSTADNDERAEVRVGLERALDTRVLPPEFQLEVEIDRKIENLTVSDVLRNPSRYERARTRDPIEPDYDNGRLVGMLFLSGINKSLHSFARGETTYQLSDGMILIRIPNGKLAGAVDQTVDVLKAREDIFDRGEDLVQIANGRLMRLDAHGLDQFLGGFVQYQKLQKSIWKNYDPPPNLSKRILTLGASRDLKPLLGVITAPTLRSDGTVLQEPGYDSATQLYLSLAGDAVQPIPEHPDDETVLRALESLMEPFRYFPFVDAVDRSVLLSALLTAAIRWALPTAPAFGFDAPVQGSGKTLLASAVGSLATGMTPVVFPHLDGKSDEEARKRLLAVFLEGRGAIVWDNILGQFDSAALASALTSSIFSDRVLGQSESRSVSSRALISLTGNNLTITGDMARRVLLCRIDPKTEQASLRQFDFDPLAYVLKNRQQLIAACLTILRGWLASGEERTPGRMASFELWDDLVRHAVIWVGRRFPQKGFTDPLKSQERSLANDSTRQNLGDLLRLLREVFVDDPFLAKNIIAAADQSNFAKGSHLHQALTNRKAAFYHKELHQVLEAMGGSQLTTNAASLGRRLGFLKDKIVDGLVLRAHRDGHSKTNMWRVERAP